MQFEKKEYEACIADCKRAVERGRELRADYKLVGRALTRQGTALVKLDRLEEGVEIYQKALTEHRFAMLLHWLMSLACELRDKQCLAGL